MATVIKRCFASTPARDAHATWAAIVDLLTRNQEGADRIELLSVSGPASSVISDQAPKDAPIIITGDGPRTRIYCIYDEDAIDGSDANEDPPAFPPLSGDWAVSLPCAKEDLDWVSKALAARSGRITARDATTKVVTEEATPSAATLAFNAEGFLGS